jgi:hypothetical protein
MKYRPKQDISQHFLRNVPSHDGRKTDSATVDIATISVATEEVKVERN